MNFGQYGGNQADRVIAKRRAQEERLAQRQRNVASTYRLGAIATWEEHDMQAKQRKDEHLSQIAKDPTEQAKQRRKQNLAQRRSQLKKLLADEETQYKREVDATLETPAERRARLEQRAKMLRQKRLQERKDFCEQARLLQFRNKCDELRSNHGKNLLMECDRVRKRQMQDKALEKQLENRDHEKYLKQWKKEYQDKLDRDNRDTMSKQKLNQETAIELAHQIKQKQEREVIEKSEQQQNIADRVAQLQQAKQEMAKLQETKLAQLQARKQETRQAYQAFHAKRQDQTEKEKLEDKEFISAVLQKEKLEREKEAMKQQGLRSDIHGYVEYLDKLKQEERDKENALNDLRQQELEKAWQKRELQWKKEELARKQLLEQVYLERQDQVAYRNKMNQSSKNNGETAKQMQEKQRVLDMQEQNKQEKRLAYNKEIQNFLKQQIDAKELIKQEDKENTRQTDSSLKAEQKEYERLIRMEAQKDEKAIRQGQTTHHYPKQSANWWTV